MKIIAHGGHSQPGLAVGLDRYYIVPSIHLSTRWLVVEIAFYLFEIFPYLLEFKLSISELGLTYLNFLCF